MPTNILSLPAELIRTLVTDFESERITLLALGSTCKIFNGEATRLLFKSMTEEDWHPHRLFCSVIVKSPYLAALVHVYHLPTSGDGYLGHLWRNVRRALPLMVDLKELLVPEELAGGPCAKNIFFAPVKFQLERLIWLPLPGGQERENAFNVLKSQINLRFLEWETSPILPDTVLSRLECASGTTSYLCEILARPTSVRKVRWEGPGKLRFPSRLSEFMKLEVLRVVKTLRLTGTHLLDRLALICSGQGNGAFHNIEELIVPLSLPVKVKPYCDHRLHRVVVNRSQNAQILDLHWHRLPLLRRIVAVTPGPSDPAVDLETCTALFGKVKSLQRVDIFSEHEPWFKRYTRQSAVPELFEASKRSYLEY